MKSKYLYVAFYNYITVFKREGYFLSFNLNIGLLHKCAEPPHFISVDFYTVIAKGRAHAPYAPPLATLLR